MNFELIIGWLYPDLMSTYGDRGNIITLTKRAKDREIKTEILNLSVGFKKEDLLKCDLLFMGGAQDRQQQIVSEDLRQKTKYLKELIEKGLPGLYICGAYQFLGNYYKEADGTIIKGLEILDLHTENPGRKNRLIGNIAIRTSIFEMQPDSPAGRSSVLIGFENHGGRTYLGSKIKQFGTVLAGYGNNGEDKTEGAIYKNSFGTYLHGPILPKNPQFADFLIKLALEKKYKKTVNLENLDDSLEEKARNAIAKRLNLKV